MATPSDAPPPSSAAENPQNPVPQVGQPINGDGNDTKSEGSPTSVFVNSEPIREDQVQNAIKFLSHPKVKGSPVMYRRSFLERKGLTKEEIDEAFRRVPDPSPAVTNTQSVVTNQGGQIKSSPNAQQQPSAQIMQPTPVGHVGNHSKIGIISRFHWYHTVLAVGLLTVSGAGTVVLFKNTVIPRLKSWIRKVVSEEGEEGSKKEKSAKPNVAEEAAAAAKAAAAAAADVARVSQEMLVTKNEEKRCFEELINMLSVQAREMKSMSSAMQKFEAGQIINGRTTLEEQANQRISVNSSRQPYSYTNGNTESFSVRSVSPPAPVEPSVAPHPKSYMDIMDMIQRGEKPSNIREINDAPPNPNQLVSNPRLAPRPKPWESNQTQNTSSNGVTTQETSNYGDNQQPNEDSSIPWWQRKVRIAEIEASDDEKKQWVPPPQRQWVPPQPPPVVMAEAAAAIRQPKKQASVLNDDQLLAQPTEVTDELQRITKIAELGGPTDANGGSYGLQSDEIAREDNGSYSEV